MALTKCAIPQSWLTIPQQGIAKRQNLSRTLQVCGVIDLHERLARVGWTSAISCFLPLGFVYDSKKPDHRWSRSKCFTDTSCLTNMSWSSVGHVGDGHDAGPLRTMNTFIRRLVGVLGRQQWWSNHYTLLSSLTKSRQGSNIVKRIQRLARVDRACPLSPSEHCPLAAVANASAFPPSTMLLTMCLSSAWI